MAVFAYHISAHVRRQEYRRPNHILCYSSPPKGYPPLHILPFFLVLKILLVQLRLDSTRQQGIASDAVFPQCDRTALHETQDACFGRRVVCLLSSTDEGRDGGDSHDGATGW